MSFKTVEHVLAAQVVDAGTFTVSYPDKRDASYYRNSFGHKIVTEQNDVYEWPADFTLTFGTGSITVTWASTRTLTAGTKLYVQLNEVGDDKRRQDGGIHENLKNYRATVSHLALINLGAPDTADTDGFCASQDLTAAGVASVSGTAAAAIAAAALAGVADVPRNVVAAWTGTAVLTVTGKDEYGNVMVERSASGTSFTGKKAFKEVTNFSVSANVTALTVGTGNVLGLPFAVQAPKDVLAEIKDGALLPRKATYVTIEGRVLCTDGTYGVVVSPFAGTITRIDTVEIDGGITTNNATLTFRIGTTNITNGVVTVATSGSAAGVKDNASPTAANVLAAGDAITVVVTSTPGGGKSVNAIFTIELDADQVLDGTFAEAVVTEPSATTGDVRGTYAPADTPNGSLEFGLLVHAPDTNYLGLDHYAG